MKYHLFFRLSTSKVLILIELVNSLFSDLFWFHLEETKIKN